MTPRDAIVMESLSELEKLGLVEHEETDTTETWRLSDLGSSRRLAMALGEDRATDLNPIQQRIIMNGIVFDNGDDVIVPMLGPRPA